MLFLGTFGCQRTPDERPNVLWIVWDTVRADHLSVYGYPRETSPFLVEWAEQARVYEDCLSTAGHTLPSHGSMFTGLMPSEHCSYNGSKRLEDRFDTIAELLAESGYQTHLYSANPHISSIDNYDQGFDSANHPWSRQYRRRAFEIVRAKVPTSDYSSELPEQLRAADQRRTPPSPWLLKATGELAQEDLLSWLDKIDPERPWFAFINYMEAHRPYIPPRSYRQRMMSPQDVEDSYAIDRSWLATWEYTFGLRDLTPREMELITATYDAALAELDDHFRNLIAALAERHVLEDTVIILTADHGEHLGEQHMLDHQYSLYQPLLRVPLIIRYPDAFPAGRDQTPVATHDLFPTLLELAGMPERIAARSTARSLLATSTERTRLAEDPVPFLLPLSVVAKRNPSWDPTPWERSLRAVIHQESKLIAGSDGRLETYRLGPERLESTPAVPDESDLVRRLTHRLEQSFAGLEQCRPTQAGDGEIPELQREMLRGLGYAE